jgi:2-methylisocitrate lyase-like PEP mutase family enzyme
MDHDSFRAMHHQGRPLVLPNAWDAASARSFAELGFPALATTSAGVARSLGFEDGQRIPADEMFAAVRRITGAVDVPVTADVEAGYGLSPSEVATRLADAGAVGCNLEDTDHAAGDGSLVAAEAQAERLAAVRAADPALVINARVDVHLRKVGPEEGRLAEAVRRARLYLEAGADCIYPIGVVDEPTLAVLVREIPAPVNVMVVPGGLPLDRLTEMGVARLTFAGGLFRTALKAATTQAADWLTG